MVVIKQNVIYDSEHDLRTDIYFPNDTSSKTKILIFWHGGGFIRGSKDECKNFGIKFANAGFMTFIPDYRLAPRYIFPAAHQDARNFIDWLLNSSYTDSDDQKNIVQIGASAGGTLALQLAGFYVFPTVTWSAPVDFSNWMKEHETVSPSPDARSELGTSTPDEIAASFYKYFTVTYIGSNNHEVLQKLDADSYDYDNLNQLMLINSSHELVELSGVFRFIHFLADSGHEVQLLTLPGSGHAMAYANDYVDESLDFLYQAIKRNK